MADDPDKVKSAPLAFVTGATGLLAPRPRDHLAQLLLQGHAARPGLPATDLDHRGIELADDDLRHEVAPQ